MKLRGLDLDDFIILAMLGDGFSITKCGAYLNITQPAVTQRIRKMEDFLGFKIVFRSGRGCRLSRPAELLSAASKKAIVLLVHSVPDPLSNGRRNMLIDYVFSIGRDGTTDESYDS